MRRSRGRGLNDDERTLWATVTRAVTPLPKRRGGKATTPATTPVSTPAAAGEPPPRVGTPMPAPIRRSPAPAASSRTVQAPPSQSDMPSALARKTRRRIASGREAIDARIDLHGYTQAQAHAALTHFLHLSAGRGARLVLVITGKGSAKAGSARAESRDGGVLRRQVPLWLALPELRDCVIGHEPAHIAHGGEGALYVRLRRRRASS
jgi:DNA-nicking Smr family endonuclease